MILDCIVMLIPISMIWVLHMSTSRKFAVTAIFGLGLITAAASVTRMAVFVQATAPRYDAYVDFEYLDTNAMYWSMVETGLGFITANSIIVFIPLTHSCLSSRFRSLRLLLFSRSSKDETQTELDSSFPKRKGFSPIGNANVSASRGSIGRDVKEMPMDEQ